MAKKGVTGNTALLFQPAANEKLVECPYDEGHRVLKHKMLGHLMKCRRNYQTKCDEMGQAMIMMQCRYNADDEVPAPEIVHHEMMCPDRQNLSTYIFTYEVGPDENDGKGKGVTTHVVNYVTRGTPEYSSCGIPPESQLAEDPTVQPMDSELVTTIVQQPGLEMLTSDGQELELDSLGAVGGAAATPVEASASSLSVSKRTQQKQKPFKSIEGEMSNPPGVKVQEVNKAPEFDAESVNWTKEEDWEQQVFAIARKEGDTYNPEKRWAEPGLMLQYPGNLSKSLRKEFFAQKQENLYSAANEGNLSHKFEFIPHAGISEVDEAALFHDFESIASSDALTSASGISQHQNVLEEEGSVSTGPIGNNELLRNPIEEDELLPTPIRNNEPWGFSVLNNEPWRPANQNIEPWKTPRTRLGLSPLVTRSVVPSAAECESEIDMSASENEFTAASTALEASDEDEASDNDPASDSDEEEKDDELGRLGANRMVVQEAVNRAAPELTRYRTILESSLLSDTSHISLADESASKNEDSNESAGADTD